MTQSNGEYKHTVLCVDDEEKILKALWRVLRKENYNILRAGSGEEGLEILKNNEVHLVLSDQRMPTMNGTEFFAVIKDLYPDTIRIILSGYTEIGSITDSINKGHVYKFFLKPWNDENLRLEIQKAIEQYDLIQANRLLTQQTIDQLEELKKVNDTLEAKVAERTKTLELKNQALELSQAVLEELPYPVLCVGSDNLIVLINKKVVELPMENKTKSLLGEQVTDIFDDNIIKVITEVLSTGVSVSKINQGIFGGVFDVYFSSMSGRFSGQGVIISILEKPPQEK